MTATEILREEVRHYIDTADERSLRVVKAILEIEQENDTSHNDLEEWDEMPEELRSAIDEALEDGGKGNTISYEQFKERYSQWFRK